MDFDSVLKVAASKLADGGVKRYSLAVGPPKKVPKVKGVQSAAVQAFLRKKEEEKRQQELDEKRRKEELLAKRKELKHDKKARAMASRTKDNFRGYNGIPVEDKPKKRHSSPQRDANANIKSDEEYLTEEERYEYSQTESEEEEEPQPPPKKMAKTSSAKKAAPPAMNFAELLQLAQKKQFEPVEIVKPLKKSDERPRTAEELRELEFLERKTHKGEKRTLEKEVRKNGQIVKVSKSSGDKHSFTKGGHSGDAKSKSHEKKSGSFSKSGSSEKIKNGHNGTIKRSSSDGGDRTEKSMSTSHSKVSPANRSLKSSSVKEHGVKHSSSRSESMSGVNGKSPGSARPSSATNPARPSASSGSSSSGPTRPSGSSASARPSSGSSASGRPSSGSSATGRPSSGSSASGRPSSGSSASGRPSSGSSASGRPSSGSSASGRPSSGSSASGRPSSGSSASGRPSSGSSASGRPSSGSSASGRPSSGSSASGRPSSGSSASGRPSSGISGSTRPTGGSSSVRPSGNSGSLRPSGSSGSASSRPSGAGHSNGSSGSSRPPSISGSSKPNGGTPLPGSTPKSALSRQGPGSSSVRPGTGLGPGRPVNGATGIHGVSAKPKCTVISETISSKNFVPKSSNGQINGMRPAQAPGPRQMMRPPGPPRPPIDISYKRRIDDEEEDSEMEDFIDDGGESQEEISKHIREIFGYDRSRYKDESDYALRYMETNFREQQKEEARSLRLGIQEDLEELKREEEELKLKAKKAKRMKTR